jgi:uncharacterized membrane protein
MARIVESILVSASLAEAWDLYFQPETWPAWVDGFDSVVAEDGYPEAGGSLRWRSIPAGRGVVTEHVLEHEPRRLHRVAYGDPQSAGELRTSFGIEGQGTRLTQELEYRLPGRGPLVWLTDRLFVRSQVSRSLAQSLRRFKHEVEEMTGASPGETTARPGRL